MDANPVGPTQRLIRNHFPVVLAEPGKIKLTNHMAASALRYLPKMQAVGEQVLGSELAGSDLPKALDAGHLC